MDQIALLDGVGGALICALCTLCLWERKPVDEVLIGAGPSGDVLQMGGAGGDTPAHWRKFRWVSGLSVGAHPPAGPYLPLSVENG